MSKRNRFTWKEMLQHYTDVASGKTPTKKKSKYSDQEQKSYAKGQRDAMNRQRGIFAFIKKKENLNDKPPSKEKVNPLKDLFRNSVTYEYKLPADEKLEKSFENGYNSAIDSPHKYGIEEYKDSQNRIKWSLEELPKSNDKDREYLMKTIATHKGKMLAYEKRKNINK